MASLLSLLLQKLLNSAVLRRAKGEDQSRNVATGPYPSIFAKCVMAGFAGVAHGGDSWFDGI